EWDAAWSGSPSATWFHSRHWAETWSSATRGRIRPQPVLLTLAGGRTVLLPVSERRGCAGLVRATLSSPAGTYGGWITAEELDAEEVAALTAFLRERFPRLTWRINPFDPSRPKPDGAEPDSTQAIDLSPGFEKVLRSWTKGHRSAARQATKAGVQILIADSIEDWRTYYAIYQDSLDRWGDKASSAYGWGLFEALHSRREEGVSLWLARHEDKAIAGALCLYAGRHVSYWHGAALSEHFGLRPVHLLLHEAIRDACAKGVGWFEFNLSGGHEGVRAFKKGFGCAVLAADVVRQAPSWTRWTRRRG
ncbi:MAG: GNAT family N-acetyltransferase, partial [Planctomycetota bacterium]